MKIHHGHGAVLLSRRQPDQPVKQDLSTETDPEASRVQD